MPGVTRLREYLLLVAAGTAMRIDAALTIVNRERERRQLLPMGTGEFIATALLPAALTQFEQAHTAHERAERRVLLPEEVSPHG